MPYPKMIKIMQTFPANAIADIPFEIRKTLKKIDLGQTVSPGESVAITAGSRGIAHMAKILFEIVQVLKEIGAQPFIVPAMGSHGGATAEGQKMVLEKFGITTASMGVPIKATMAVVSIGTTPDGLPVFIDEAAARAEHIVVVNRIKPHTEFKGPVESGLMKMAAIGLGNQQGAELYHRAVIQYGYYHIIRSVAREVIRRSPILFGLAVVENQSDETAVIRAVRPEDIEKTEEELLVVAKARIPKIPFNPIDLLIVDLMGKDISGSGMDPNVIGRQIVQFADFTTETRITRILVRDLSERSYGNADGIGLADFTTKRLVDKIDRQTMYTGCLTAGAPECGRIPIYFDTDREAVDAALKSIGLVTPEQAKIVHITSTLHLREMEISEALLPDAERDPAVETIGRLHPMKFDDDGSLDAMRTA
jgi:Lactate racemase N-terminal domain